METAQHPLSLLNSELDYGHSIRNVYQTRAALLQQHQQHQHQQQQHQIQQPLHHQQQHHSNYGSSIVLPMRQMPPTKNDGTNSSTRDFYSQNNSLAGNYDGGSACSTSICTTTPGTTATILVSKTKAKPGLPLLAKNSKK